MVVNAIEEEIQAVAKNSEQAERALEKGSDDYINKAIDLHAKFNPFVEQLAKLNEHTMDAFDQTPQEVYDRILPRMHPLYESCIRNINGLRESDVAEALSNLIEGFEIQASLLKENESDIQMIHKDFPEDEELQALLSQL